MEIKIRLCEIEQKSLTREFHLARSELHDDFLVLGAVNLVWLYAFDEFNRFGDPLWSAKTRSSAGSREGVFVMQPAQDRFGTDRIEFSATMP